MLTACCLYIFAINDELNVHLPPTMDWHGASESLIKPETDPWVTPAESSSFRFTPTYDQTYAWLNRLVAASAELEMISIGSSDGGYEIKVVIASKDRSFTPESMKRSGKPILFVQAGIHAGEIDGKDAGMMLLRDITQGSKSALLDNCQLLFLPILNADGHERASALNRINQRGPEIMGWRTNSRNLNLNRDYTKLDTSELRALIPFINRWQPHLYLDLHVTDGIDYQYDITFGHVGTHGYSPAIAGWLRDSFTPAVNAALSEAGHIPGPLIFAIDDSDPSKGIIDWMGGPRFSNAYGDLRHLPSVLVENHSLKPYRQRVLGTYVLIESSMRVLAAEYQKLAPAIVKDMARRPDKVTLNWRVGDAKPEIMSFLGIAYENEISPITGAKVTRWLGTPKTYAMPYIKMTQPSLVEPRPIAYWVPGSWVEVIDRLRDHGIEMTVFDRAQQKELQILKLVDPTYGETPYEGRVRVTASYVTMDRQVRMPAGSVRIATDQPLGEFVMILLEPSSPDSLFQWGFFHSILQPTEYAEAYAMEPLAQAMLASDPQLKALWESELEASPELRVDPRARLEWFYKRSDYFDQNYLVYPIGREI